MSLKLVFLTALASAVDLQTECDPHYSSGYNHNGCNSCNNYGSSLNSLGSSGGAIKKSLIHIEEEC